MRMLTLTVLLACTGGETNPNTITKSDIQTAVPKKDIKTICTALKSSDEDVQQFATEQLRIFEPEQTKDCLKEGLVESDSKAFRLGVLEGLKGEKRNAVARVAAELIQDTSLVGRAEAIHHLGGVPAPAVNAALMKIAENGSDASDVRAVAIRAVGGYTDNFDSTAALFDDGDAEVKAAVVDMLGLHTEEKGARKLIKEALPHEDENVRAAAMKAYRAHAGDRAEEVLCTAMMDDTSPKVRAAAIAALEKTKSVSAIRCLRKRAMTLEEDRDVRAAILRSLKLAEGNAERPAFTAMCDAIPFWLRSYTTDKLPEEDPGTDIVKMQNDYDHEYSEKCFAKAYAQKSQYSCHGHKYIAWFYKQMISNEDLYVPECEETAAP